MTGRDQACGKDQPRERAKWTDVAGVVLTFALLACAGAAILVSYWQWGAAHDQLEFAINSAASSGRDTQAALAVSDRLAKAAERQASNAEKSTVIQKLQLEASKAAMEEQLRAEVALFVIPPQGYTAGSKISTQFILQNVGDIRISDVGMIVGIGLYTSNQPMAKLFNLLVIPKDLVRVPVAPKANATVNIATAIPVTAEMVKAVADGSHRVLIYGAAEYKDILGRDHRKYLCGSFYGPAEAIVSVACPAPPDT